MALITGIIYFGQEYNTEGIQNVNGAIFLMLVNQSFDNMFPVVNVSVRLYFLQNFRILLFR